jgi:two-component system invasion response regulator UvrY
MYRFIIADDHEVVRKGLIQILIDGFPSALIEGVTNGEDLIEKVTAENWDLIICDISMPGKSGLEVLAEIRHKHPKIPFLILSAYSEQLYAVRALRAGASGFLNKDSVSSELIKAINSVLLGRKYITPAIADSLVGTLNIDPMKPLHEFLSGREFEVFKLLAGGKSVSGIAEQFKLSITTISTYRTRIMSKLNLVTNADLTFYCMEHKLF